MGHRTSPEVFLALPCLLLIPDLVLSQGRQDNEGLDALDIPLLSQLDAPLKATLDITQLNKQLTSLIDKKVIAGVDKAVENLVKKTIENQFKLSQKEIIAWNNNTLGTVQNKIKGLEDRFSPVAFFAYRSLNLKIKSSMKHTVIIYNMVDLNLGNAYNKNNGKFTSPSDGLYLFHVSTGVINRSHAVVELAVNGAVKDIGWSDSMDHNDRNQVTTATPLNLKKGDVVYARIGNAFGGNYIESNQYIRTSFSGVKIM